MQDVKSYTLFSITQNLYLFPHSSISLVCFCSVQRLGELLMPLEGRDCFVGEIFQQYGIFYFVDLQRICNFQHIYLHFLSQDIIIRIVCPRIFQNKNRRIDYLWLQLISNQMEAKEIVLVQGKLSKIVHAEGAGERPNKGQEIYALYKGTLQDGTLFDSNQDRDNPFTFVLGQGRVIKGWDEGFASMQKGEKATLICSPEYAYGASGSPPKIPANATLNFEVQLLDFKDKKKEKWEFSDEEKMAEATKSKVGGNEKLKTGDYKGAVENYKEGIDFLEHEHASEAKQLLNILRLNISQAYLKLGKYAEVIDNCTKVLKEEADNHKALYRRGIAFSKSQDFDKAKNDFNELIKLDPQNAEAKKELANVAAQIKAFEKKEKKLFGAIFSKPGLYDDVKTTESKPAVTKTESEQDEGEHHEDHEEQKPEFNIQEIPAQQSGQKEKTE